MASPGGRAPRPPAPAGAASSASAAPPGQLLAEPPPTVVVGLDLGTWGTGAAYARVPSGGGMASSASRGASSAQASAAPAPAPRSGLSAMASAAASAGAAAVARLVAAGAAAAAAAAGTNPAAPAASTLPAVFLHTGWPGAPEGAAGPKTRTALLYRDRHLVGGVGLARLAPLGPPHGARARERAAEGHLLVESFKALVQPPGPRQQQGERGGGGGGGGGTGGGGGNGGLELSAALRPVLPRGLDVTQVLADYLTALKRYLLPIIRAQLEGPAGDSDSGSDGGGDSEDGNGGGGAGGARPPGFRLDPGRVLWVLTLPAMWGEAAKARVREAAWRAGLIRARSSHLLLLALEPEAAALAASAHPAVGAAAAVGGRGGTALPLLRPGQVVLVADCGGGTVDVTLHATQLGAAAGAAGAAGLGTGRTRVVLREAAAGDGAWAGGRFVDDALWGELGAALGEGAWGRWRGAQPGDWTWLQDGWEAAKRTWGCRGRSNGLTLPLPDSLLRELQAVLPEADDGSDSPDDDDGPSDDSDDDDSGDDGSRAASTAAAGGLALAPGGAGLRLTAALLRRRVFGPVVERAVEVVRRVAAAGAARGQPPTQVMLTGGFAASPFLQRRFRRLCAELPAAAAAATTTAASAAAAAAMLPLPLLLPEHPAAAVAQGAVLFGLDPAAVADGMFAPLVAVGQLVGAEEVVERYFAPFERSQEEIEIVLYGSSSPDVAYLAEAGVRRLGRMVLRLPEGWAGCEEVRQYGSWGYLVQAELRFGSTEVALEAHHPGSGERVGTRVAWEELGAAE
ncbi:hypothetical protein HYH03_005820 [Edaphochlamys debaryana]|uniref:Uncharacterized protein n=1 Tax=Edaphochlamys debaryana TaxID=47281 RepID=A0A835Y706_9CHLO|nr:hypothetical protein HYH03_005820 [Edaphochlamys debaryana]|eukprot:KAG2496222.1 hypothetical protein HYH03_005820 [Edaphochlamys debaryana]